MVLFHVAVFLLIVFLSAIFLGRYVEVSVPFFKILFVYFIWNLVRTEIHLWKWFARLFYLKEFRNDVYYIDFIGFELLEYQINRK